MRSMFLRPAQLCAALTALLCAMMDSVAHAQDYPSRPVQVVVPFPPGGATDLVGRLVGQKLGDQLGQPVLIENRAGAGTVVGAGYVARSAPDGHVLLISSGSTFTVNPAIRARLPYDPVKSFDPIALIARVPLILVAHPQTPFGDAGALIAAVRAAPGQYVYGSFGAGTTGHFAGERFWRAVGLQVAHVPYKGSAPAIADLIGGQIPLSVDTVAATLPHIRSGKLKAIAVMGGKRSPLLPDVPTVAEAGHPDFDADAWIAVVAPRGIPEAAKTRLEAGLAQAMADPETQAKLLSNGLAPDFQKSAVVAELIERELPRMRAIAQQAGIRAD